VLDRAIDRVTSDPKKVHHPVTLRLLELGIKMLCNDTGDAVLHYTYPEVRQYKFCNARENFIYFHVLFCLRKIVT
jgi:hypothetical protein